MDISILVTSLGALLAPVLPVLVKGGEKAVEKVAEVVGEKLATAVSDLWSSLRKRGTVEAVATELGARPDDADARAAFERQLTELLAAEPDLVTAARRLVEQAEAGGVIVRASGGAVVAVGRGAVAAGAGGVAVGGDVHGGISIGARSDRD